MSDQAQKAATPWWRQRWPWLLIAGPAATVVGCIITIVLAVQYFGDQALTHGAVKRGLKVERTARPPAQAEPPAPAASVAPGPGTSGTPETP